MAFLSILPTAVTGNEDIGVAIGGPVAMPGGVEWAEATPTIPARR